MRAVHSELTAPPTPTAALMRPANGNGSFDQLMPLAATSRLLRRGLSSYAAAMAHLQAPRARCPTSGVVEASGSPAYTLAAAAYTDDKIFAEEQSSIFGRSWGYLDHLVNLPKPGSYVTANLAGEEILLARDKKVRGFYNVCAHRAHRMVEPGSSGTRPVLLCPNHGWSYKLDGSLHKARGAPAEEFDPVEFGLSQIRVQVFNGLIFGNLDSQAAELFSSLEAGGLGEEIEATIPQMCDMQLEAVVEKTVHANWKAMVDNFLECYHCDVAHKDFVDMVDMQNYKTFVHRRHVRNYSPCRPENSAYSFAPDAPCKAFDTYWLWPNTVIYAGPGNPNMSILQFIPQSAETTLRRAFRFFAKPTSEAREETVDGKKAREAAVAYLNEVLLEEDTKLCESIQQGLHSRGYSQGKFVIDPADGWGTERSVAQFHALVHHALAADA